MTLQGEYLTLFYAVNKIGFKNKIVTLIFYLILRTAS